MEAITSFSAPVFEELLLLMGSFNRDNFNLKPSGGGWSAGQTAQHIRLSAGGILKTLYATTIQTDRDPEQYVAQIREVLMDFGHKRTSPPLIEPQEGNYDPEKLAKSFSGLKDDFEEAIEHLDLSCTCLDFQLPGFGLFTRIEWLAFMIYHTQRHIHQMRSISQKI